MKCTRSRPRRKTARAAGTARVEKRRGHKKNGAGRPAERQGAPRRFLFCSPTAEASGQRSDFLFEEGRDAALVFALLLQEGEEAFEGVRLFHHALQVFFVRSEIGLLQNRFDFRPKRFGKGDGAEKFVRRNLSRAAEGEGEKIARLFAAEDEPKRLCAVCRE